VNLSSWMRLLYCRPLVTDGVPTGALTMGLTEGWKSVRLDKVGSVSGSILLETDWNDTLLDEQYRRFLNGS